MKLINTPPFTIERVEKCMQKFLITMHDPHHHLSAESINSFLLVSHRSSKNFHGSGSLCGIS